MSNFSPVNLISKLELGVSKLKSFSRKSELIIDASLNTSKQVFAVINLQLSTVKRALEEDKIVELELSKLEKIMKLRPKLVELTVMSSERDLYNRRLGKYSPMNTIDKTPPTAPPVPNSSFDKKTKLAIAKKFA